MEYDVVVIGGGAAGLFCAAIAGARGRKVLVIEHNSQLGRKILISGGGRCNFTNIFTAPENFISQNPHFCKSALARYTPNDFIRLVEKYDIDYYEKKLGQLFCRDRSRLIVEMLVSECSKVKAEIKTSTRVEGIDNFGARFELATSAGTLKCDSVVIATGGLSFPKIGATDFGYSTAKRFGLKIVPTRPSLVPLVFAGDGQFRTLAGVSVDSTVTAGGRSFRENILFTHRGLSGPAILQASNYWTRKEPVSIDLMPGIDAEELLKENRSSRQRLDNFLGRFLPNRFAEIFTELQLPNKPVDQLSSEMIRRTAERLNGWQVYFRDTEGYDKAEVTAGGVSTDELSSQTMEAKKVPGLYFIGEVVDVTGWLGGYNFQWAWSSAYAAGNAV